MKKLDEEEVHLYNHIIQANELEDLKQWVALMVKRIRQQKKDAAGQPSGLFSYLFSWGVAKETGEGDPKQQITEDDMEALKQQLQDVTVFDESDEQLGLSAEEKRRLVRLKIEFEMSGGELLLEDKGDACQLYYERLVA